jgi:hypothetical protein
VRRRAGCAMIALTANASGAQRGQSEAERIATARQRVCTSRRTVLPWPQRKAQREQPSTNRPEITPSLGHAAGRARFGLPGNDT